jgi:hypothetical protein
VVVKQTPVAGTRVAKGSTDGSTVTIYLGSSG